MSERSGRACGAAALAGVLALAGLVWIGIAVSSIRRDPGLDGWLTGVVGGGLLALFVACGGAWAILTLMLRPARRSAEPALLNASGELASILAELETVRQRTVRQIRLGAAWRIPLCLTAAVVLWLVSQTSDDPSDGSDLLAFLAVGGFAGYMWAARKLSETYRRLYKERVLPKIAASFGPLAWRPARPPLDDFRRHRLFPDWDGAGAEDEIHGDYRGLPLSIVELKLTKGSGKNERTIFNGLTCDVTLPRGLSGITVVVPDRGLFGNMAERLRGGPCEPVRLEDPAFEKAYEVYSSDQIGARALLTPAFMERFLALAQSGRFGAPAALVQGNRLIMALAKSDGRDLFEPPSYTKPAAGREALTQLHADIEAVLRAADAVIDLDQAARLQPRP